MSEYVKKLLKDYYNEKIEEEKLRAELNELTQEELIDFILEAQPRRNLELLGIYEDEE